MKPYLPSTYPPTIPEPLRSNGVIPPNCLPGLSVNKPLRQRREPENGGKKSSVRHHPHSPDQRSRQSGSFNCRPGPPIRAFFLLPSAPRRLRPPDKNYRWLSSRKAAQIRRPQYGAVVPAGGSGRTAGGTKRKNSGDMARTAETFSRRLLLAGRRLTNHARDGKDWDVVWVR